MIRKLQIKFILLSMSAFLLVLTIIIGSINLINYNGIIEEADELLEFLSENKGAFPSGHRNEDGRRPPNMSPETPYESRYFFVILDKKSDSIVATDTSHIISVDSSDAIDYTQIVIRKKSQRGFVDDFRYIKKVENDTIRIIFLDCGRILDSFEDFLLTSIGISISGYIVVFALITFFSNRIIRPISESYEKQKRFITDAGHEIKTPLTIIRADTDILEMELGENEWLEDIQKQAKRLSSLTNDLVYLARMEESETPIQMIEFPLSDIVSEAASSFYALAQNKEFRCEIQPLLSLRGDEKAIHQLISILLDNALKYSPEGGLVSLTLEKQNRLLRLSVFNTTESTISKENLNQLFDRFYRIDQSRNSRTGGYGIGLSVAKAIVAAHNGKIQACSEDGHSLRITVTFPL